MILYIAAGGLVGTLARYFLQGWLQTRTGAGAFPIGTLAVNVAGSFVLGFLIRYATGSTVIAPEIRAALTIGFCGAFTTMSTFAFESQALLVDGDYWRAFLYMGATLIGCLAFTFAGIWLADRLL
jgi:fluoride exporter